MAKILFYACDQHFYQYLKASFASFCKCHDLTDWRVVFANVGLKEWQAKELSHFGEVVAYEPYKLRQFDGVIYAGAKARIKMLQDFCNLGDILLYLDSDTLIYESLEPLLDDFDRSGKSIGMCLEDIAEFWRSPVSSAWRDHKIPEEYGRQDHWRNFPMANAGVLLAKGELARKIGEVGLSMFDRYGDALWLPEQAVLDTLLYDWDVPFYKLPPKYNCLAWEKCIAHVGTGFRYVDTRPFFRGEPVAVRHFCGHDEALKTTKTLLDEALPLLDSDARLQRIRLSHGSPSRGEVVAESSRIPSIAVAVNVFKESQKQLEECFRRIFKNLPNAWVAVFLDGVERPEIAELATKFGFLIIETHQRGTNASWHQWWLRMLRFFHFSRAKICFKFDPDTMVDCEPSDYPDAHYFGCIESGSNFIQGGITGISGELVKIIIEKRLLEPTPGQEKSWLTWENDHFADDQALAFMLSEIGVQPFHWDKCKSQWKREVLNAPMIHAIVHPRYYA